MSGKTEPTQDFGFYATVPRLIRTDYKNLTAVQKWLYVCLKDLCGDHGTCYRSLRSLAEETGISTGMLSESIRALQKAELIRAEKKKRSTGGKEVWHISIVDIWTANGKTHPSKRSAGEQTGQASSENVHTVNQNVQSANKKRVKRSPAEQERSLCETEERTSKQEHSKGKTGKEEGASTPSSPSSSDNIYSLEENETLSWLNELHIPYREKNIPLVKEQLAQLRQNVNNKEMLHKLYGMAVERCKGLPDPTVSLGNLIGKQVMAAFLQSQAKRSIDEKKHEGKNESERVDLSAVSFFNEQDLIDTMANMPTFFTGKAVS